MSPDRFLVVAGHEHADRLVAGSDAYSVVAAAAAVAPVSAAS